jgi:sugar phosphate isomerase/epimerase
MTHSVPLTRRRFGQVAASALSLLTWPQLAPAAQLHSTYKGVRLGVITGSIAGQQPLPADRDPIDVLIERCIAVDAANVELVSVYGPTPPAVVNGGRFGQVPAVVTPEYLASREKLRQWRLAEPDDRYVEVRRKFQKAGLNLFSYVWTVSDDYSPEEIDAGFRKLRALGVKMFTTNQSRFVVAPKVMPVARKYGIYAAWHPHDNVDDAREIATFRTLERLIDLSPEFRVNLDIGHFTAGNQDAVAFLAQHHDRVTHLHIKDRKRNHGPNVQLGTGDTPIAECVRMVRDHKWPIYVLLEREYNGDGSPVEQTRWQMEYLRKLLDT